MDFTIQLVSEYWCLHHCFQKSLFHKKKYYEVCEFLVYKRPQPKEKACFKRNTLVCGPCLIHSSFISIFILYQLMLCLR